MGETWHGPFRVPGDPHPDDDSNTSYHSQISSVFKVEGKKDLYVALADRWVPDHLEYDYKEYKHEFAKMFSEGSDASWNMERFGEDGTRNTSIADYVWLPRVWKNKTISKK